MGQYLQYKHSTVAMSWADARANCRAWSGNLTSPKNLIESRQLRAMFDPGNRYGYWIGLHTKVTKDEGHLVWTDPSCLAEN